MIIRLKNRQPVLVTDKVSKYPVLPLKTGVLFPGQVLTIQVGLPANLKLIDYCLSGNREFIASYSPFTDDDEENPRVSEISVLGRIRDAKEASSNSKIITIEGIQRMALDKILERQPLIKATANRMQLQAVGAEVFTEAIEDVIDTVREIIHLDPTYSPEMLRVIKMSQDDPSLFADAVAANFRFPLPSRQEILETVNLKVRFKRLLNHLNVELSQVATVYEINENVSESLEREQRKHFLRQQLREIRKQLGEDLTEEREAARIKSMVKARPDLPPDVVSRAYIEADRLTQLSTASAEYGVTKNYLDWLLALPWEKFTPEEYDIRDAEKVLSKEYFGSTSIKEQILQRLSVRKLLGGVSEGPALCLVGAHGTGKASLARAVARAMGKEFIRISAGGIADVAEIKGTPRTFLGAMPGKIIRALKDAGSCDPVILIEDIDYFNIENDSSVNMALLEVIDVRHNSRFLDTYLGVPFDLSKVFFICSVRSYEELPEQFIDRMEILELPGYIEKEKIVIAKRYIIPSLLKKHGILKSELKFAQKILSKIINNYTMEAGLTGFSQQIEKICRKIALEKVEKKKTSWRINEKNLESFLGQPIFIPEKPDSQPEIGSATGLAWTGSGGDLMFIEGLKMKGDGNIFSTGSLGDVMKESIQAAHSYVRSKADMLGVDANDFNEFDIHVHFPSGAIPKDGPSAGITVCLVIASVMSERPIRNDIAMTGEVTLRGRVLPVGGIKEKVSAAYRAGIYHVALPKENEKDLKELPREIIRKTKFTYIERVDELFETCLLNFTPSAFTLEKVFAEEMEKARKKQLKRTPKAKPKAKPKVKPKAKPKSTRTPKK
jgi:ATP-dependent Lon protease